VTAAAAAAAAAAQQQQQYGLGATNTKEEGGKVLKKRGKRKKIGVVASCPLCGHQFRLQKGHDLYTYRK
jgi:hypothetical protein